VKRTEKVAEVLEVETESTNRRMVEARRRLDGLRGAAVPLPVFQVRRSRSRRMRFSMGFQSDFCCSTASQLRRSGIDESSNKSQWLNYAPEMEVLRTRKCVILSTSSVRHVSGLLLTGLSETVI
jgi:hypothetical protein